MVNYYSKEKAIPMIIALLAKQGVIITEHNIKFGMKTQCFYQM